MAARLLWGSELQFRKVNGDSVQNEMGVRPKGTTSQTSGGAKADLRNLERTVNHWILEFNFHYALQAFRDGEYEEFCTILNVITAVLNRPYIDTEEIGTKLLTIQFLSKFESDTFPLESILTILGRMKTELTLDEDLFQEVRGAVVKQAVVESIKKSRFREASKMLEKNLNKDTAHQKLLSAVIKERNSSHPDLDLFSYCNLKKRMLCFAESLISNTVPFLLLSAEKSTSTIPEIQNDVRLTCVQVGNQNVPTSDGNKCLSSPGNECCVCSSRVEEAQPCSLIALQTAFSVLHKSILDPLTLFEKMDILDFNMCESREMQSRTRSKKQKMKAMDIQRSKKPSANCIQAVSRFVIDPDSQDEVECPDTVSDGKKTIHNDRESPNKPHNGNVASKEIMNQETSLNVKRQKLFNHPGVVEKKEDWSDEELLFGVPRKNSVQNGRTSPTESTFSCSSKRQKWTVEESEWIKEGVQKFGAGNWLKILKHYPFCDRTSVMIKDRWRTMQKQSMT
ncbi:telomeric repeat binding factor a [Rhinoraja longicauda]